MNWRQLEAEIVDIAREHTIPLDEWDGHKYIVFTDSDDNVTGQVDLTAFAQELAQRLQPKAISAKVDP